MATGLGQPGGWGRRSAARGRDAGDDEFIRCGGRCSPSWAARFAPARRPSGKWCWAIRCGAGGSAAIAALVGRTIRLDDQNYTVIGIMPPNFYFPRPSREVWVPLALPAEQRNSRSALLVDSMGRLKPGHRLAELAPELAGLASRLEREHPDTNAGRRFMAWTFQRYTTGDLVPVYSALLLGSAFFVLLIACVNVANLQFARATGRLARGGGAHGPGGRTAAAVAPTAHREHGTGCGRRRAGPAAGEVGPAFHPGRRARGTGTLHAGAGEAGPEPARPGSSR